MEPIAKNLIPFLNSKIASKAKKIANYIEPQPWYTLKFL